MHQISWVQLISGLLGSAVFASLLSTVLNHILTGSRSAEDRGRSAKYIAVMVAVVLEKFAIDCASVVADIGDFNSNPDGPGRAHGSLPKLDPYPGDVDWETLFPPLLDRVMSLRNELSVRDGKISFWAKLGEYDCIPNACSEQAAIVGLKAWKLASDLRRSYGLPNCSRGHAGWDFVDTLEREVKENEEQERRNRQRRESMLAAQEESDS